MTPYSVVIPAYNEGEHIESFVEAFLAGLAEPAREALLEIILVENGSTDDTLAACERLRERYPDTFRVFHLERGSYGEAIKRGIAESRGDFVSILECDFLDRDFIATSVERFSAGQARFIVASKRHPDSVDKRPFKRRLLTLGFNCLLRLFLHYPGTDTHGLKSIETRLAKRLCAESTTTDEVLQTELVLLAWRWGEAIDEVPIRITERRPTIVSVARRLPKVATMISELRASLARY